MWMNDLTEAVRKFSDGEIQSVAVFRYPDGYLKMHIGHITYAQYRATFRENDGCVEGVLSYRNNFPVSGGISIALSEPFSNASGFAKAFGAIMDTREWVDVIFESEKLSVEGDFMSLNPFKRIIPKVLELAEAVWHREFAFMEEFLGSGNNQSF